MMRQCPYPAVKECGQHAQDKDVQIGRKLIKIRLDIKQRPGEPHPEQGAKERNHPGRQERPAPHQGDKQGEHQVQLHFKGQCPQRRVEIGIVVRLHAEHVGKDQVQSQILWKGHIAPVIQAPCQCDNEHNQNRQVIGGNDPHQAFPVEIPDGKRFIRPQAGTGQVETESGQQNHDVHMHVPGAHQRVQADPCPKEIHHRIQPGLLPDVKPGNHEDCQNTYSVTNGHIAVIRRFSGILYPIPDELHVLFALLCRPHCYHLPMQHVHESWI